jgi:hypothetical protein
MKRRSANSSARTIVTTARSLGNRAVLPGSCTDRRAPALAGRLPRPASFAKPRLRRVRPAKAGALRVVRSVFG